MATRSAPFLTFSAEAGAGGEAGHIDDLHSKLLARVPVDAAAYHTERSPTIDTNLIRHLRICVHIVSTHGLIIISQHPCGRFGIWKFCHTVAKGITEQL